MLCFELIKHIRHGYNLILGLMFNGRPYHHNSTRHNPESIYSVENSQTRNMTSRPIGAEEYLETLWGEMK
jgi:hypothetical protein